MPSPLAGSRNLPRLTTKWSTGQENPDGLFRTPTRALNISKQPKTGGQSESKNLQDDKSEWPNRLTPTNYMEKEGDILDSDKSVAHCVSADFKTR